MENFKVMLAKPLVEKKLSFPCIVSPKLDGIRVQYYKGEFYTRNQKVVRGMSHLKKALAFIGAEKIWLDGELMVPGVTFQKSSGLIRSYSETPSAVYHVFDAPYVEDTLPKRLEIADKAVGRARSPHVAFVPHLLCEDHAKVMRLYKEYREEGYEGIMVKKLHSGYFNKRSDLWMKIKEVETYDVKCVGFFEGMGRLTGTLGGVIVELDEVRVRVGGGFSDDDRHRIWENRSRYRGMICEIAGQEKTPGGSLRHPRFIDWRTDL